ncbi:MAG: YbhB/YbcL family Raf kinase inhibitor-like protein [Sphingobacteriia bacterium]|nr:YbhB/YbcL family Raf kinase inhibitor-like protein [Sphingobacteriia bacterium]NCC38634.1 YbhB/YbcL family Raf kinase inhibitor-like protein [Gammaproteobacteria bacterium]
MRLFSDSFADGAAIPAKYAFARIDPRTHISLSDNLNPHLAWTNVPPGTQSFVLICHDPDVPSSGEDVNQDGKLVPASLPRVDFYHWLLLDIPSTTTALAEGSHSSGVTPGGKSGPSAPHGMRHGINDYTAWFAGDPQMQGDYYGYDGPCPPWNDERLHHYVFTLYALDLPALDIAGELSGKSILAALDGHILAQASLSGTYSLNPAVLA